MTTAGFIYIWEYRVRDEDRERFHRHYGPEGSWVRLFRQADGYVNTMLYHDLEDDQRFVTVDQWRSEAAFRAFRERFSAAFDELDRVGETLTLDERCIGHLAPAEHR